MFTSLRIFSMELLGSFPWGASKQVAQHTNTVEIPWVANVLIGSILYVDLILLVLNIPVAPFTNMV